MGKNKACRNAFYYFMIRYKDKYMKQETDMKVVAEAAGPVWEKMNAEERKPFEESAKSNKQGQKVVKYTSTGQKIDVVQKREMEKNAKEQKMKETIEKTVEMAAETGRIAEKMFYFMHINYFCLCNNPKKYYPAEIAVARFTLGVGVTDENVFHAMVKPGPLPLGYSYQAVKNSEETHQIPPPMGDEAEDNLTHVMNSLMNFITELNDNKRVIPPMYVEAKNKEVVESVLKNFAIDCGHDEDMFKVYSMEYLFYILRNNVGERAVFPTVSLSTLELEKDVYEFAREIPCGYHEDSDVPNHCSRSHVIRCAFVICDNCCGDLGIELIPGRHVPHQANVTASRPQSVASGYSTPSSRRAPARGNPRLTEYLSQQTERTESFMSDTGSMYDPHDDTATLGGYDSEYLSQADDPDEWLQPKQRHRRHDNRQMLSQSSANSGRTTLGIPFTPPDASGPSSTQSSSQQCRRPNTMSDAFMGMSVSTMRGVAGTSGNAPVRRGRGLGIAANFTNKMN